MILGLTGGIGSGKSTVSNMFSKNGIKTFDADIIAKNFLKQEDVKKEIINRLGNEFIDSKTNEVDKIHLKNEVFKNKDKLKILNSIIHPKVEEYYRNIREEYRDKKEIIIFDVPLLFEAKLDYLCDKIIVVDTDINIQIKRIKERDFIDEELINEIIESQMEKKERDNKANIIIENNGTLEDLEKKVDTILNELKRGI